MEAVRVEAGEGDKRKHISPAPFPPPNATAVFLLSISDSAAVSRKPKLHPLLGETAVAMLFPCIGKMTKLANVTD